MEGMNGMRNMVVIQNSIERELRNLKDRCMEEEEEGDIDKIQSILNNNSSTEEGGKRVMVDTLNNNNNFMDIKKRELLRETNLEVLQEMITWQVEVGEEGMDDREELDSFLDL